MPDSEIPPISYFFLLKIAFYRLVIGGGRGNRTSYIAKKGSKTVPGEDFAMENPNLRSKMMRNRLQR